MNVNINSWLTETSLTPYPLTKSFGYDAMFTDASFIQFDNFVPVLKSVAVHNSDFIMAIIFDLSTETFTIPIDDISTIGSSYRLTSGTRYLGKLVFGSGVSKFVEASGDNTTLSLNIPFLTHTVKSIPSGCGVFALNSKFGALQITSDDFISFESEDVEGVHQITFNAIAIPPDIDEPYLKTLNLIGPTSNSVFIASTDIIKVQGQASTIEISLVGTAASEATIVTSDDNA